MAEEFTDIQIYEIELGKERDLDISWYAKPEFNDLQMKEIRLGLKQGINVESYLNNNISNQEMQIKKCKKLD